MESWSSRVSAKSVVAPGESQGRPFLMAGQAQVEISEPFWLRDPEVATNLAGKMVVDLGVSRHRAARVECQVVPPRMARSFAKQSAIVGDQVRQEIAALHTAICSSS